MATLLKQNGVYGMAVGHRTVFTIEGAIERYKLFLETCYSPLTVESAAVLMDVQNDMVKLGMTWEEVENIENEYLEGAN
jgi:hypothetical protein